MRKLLYVLLALTVAFAMTSCGGDDGGGGGGPEQWTVTYDANGWTQGAVPSPAKVTKGQSVTLPTLTFDNDTGTQEFRGWATGGSGNGQATGATLSGSYTPSADVTLSAVWVTILPVGTSITITYDANGWEGTGVPTATKTGKSGTKLGDNQFASDPLLPALTSTANQLFLGWATTASGDVITADTAAPRNNITLYVRYQNIVNISFVADVGGTPEVVILNQGQTFEAAQKALPDPGTKAGYAFARWVVLDDDGEEDYTVTKDSSFAVDTDVVGVWYSITLTVDNKAKAILALENAAEVIVKFAVSGTANWGDNYSGISVEYKISEAETLKQIRAGRLHGVYTDKATASDFITDANGVKVAKFDGKNATYILNDKGVAWQYEGGFRTLGYEEGDEWFTVTYPIDGTGKNGGYLDANLPGAANNLGETTVYFSFGIPGTNAGGRGPDSGDGAENTPSQEEWLSHAIVQLIGDVTLVGKGSTPSVVGSLDFDGNGNLAFAGYEDGIFWSWGSLDPNDTPERPTPPRAPCTCPNGTAHLQACGCAGVGLDCTCTIAVGLCDNCDLKGLTLAEAVAADKFCTCTGHPTGCCLVCETRGDGEPVVLWEVTDPTPHMYGSPGYKADGSQTYDPDEVATWIIKFDTTDDKKLIIDVKEFDFNANGGGKTGYLPEANPYKDLTGDALKAKVEEVLGVKFFDATDYDTTSETIDSEEENPYFELTGDELKAAAEENDPDYDEDTYDADNYDTTNEFIQVANPYKGLTGDALKAAVAEAEGITFAADPYDANDYDTSSENIYVQSTKQGTWGGGGIWFELPENFHTYTSITVEYTGSVGTTGGGNSYFVSNNGAAIPLTMQTPQVGLKQGQSSFGNIASQDNGQRYKNIESGDKSYTWAITDVFSAAPPNGVTNHNGISFQINAWDRNNTPAAGSFKVTKITLTP